MQQGFWTPDRLKKSHQEMSSREKLNKYCIIGLGNSEASNKTVPSLSASLAPAFEGGSSKFFIICVLQRACSSAVRAADS